MFRGLDYGRNPAAPGLTPSDGPIEPVQVDKSLNR